MALGSMCLSHVGRKVVGRKDYKNYILPQPLGMIGRAGKEMYGPWRRAAGVERW